LGVCGVVYNHEDNKEGDDQGSEEACIEGVLVGWEEILSLTTNLESDIWLDLVSSLFSLPHTPIDHSSTPLEVVEGLTGVCEELLPSSVGCLIDIHSHDHFHSIFLTISPIFSQTTPPQELLDTFQDFLQYKNSLPNS